MGNNPVVLKMVSNIETFKKLVETKMGPTAPDLHNLIMAVEEVLIEAPASSRTEYQGCYPGGLVEHSLNVVKLMSELNKAYGTNLSASSIVLTGLFHDIGKVGNGHEPYYTEKDSDWHRKQGILYDVNPQLSVVPVSTRSLFLLQKHSVKICEEEYLAIASIKDRPRSEENLPNPGESMLAVVLQQAIRVACLRGRGKTSLSL